MNTKVTYLLMVVMGLILVTPLKVVAGGDALYRDAASAYRSFSENEGAKSSRANWLKIIGKFERVYQEDPNSRSAAKAYFMAGKLSYQCFKYHKNRAEMERGKKNLETFLRKYPNDPMADSAEYYLGEIYLKAGNREQAAYHYKIAMERYPNGDMKRHARQRLEQMKLWPMPVWLKNYHPGQVVASAPPPAQATPIPQKNPPPAQVVPESGATTGRVLIKQIKHMSSGNYTRVIIYCKQKAKYGEIQYAKANPAQGAPSPRLFIDILDARLAPGADKPLPINDGLLLKVRAGQFSLDKVRVVLDIDAIDPDQTKVFPMEETGGDFRIVIDVSAPGKKKAKAPGDHTRLEEKKIIRRIVLDPGHGGSDPGAIGPKGIEEKDVTLSVALRAREIIQKTLGLDVKLTREKDMYLPLEERTAYANMMHIEDQTLFISLHANAAEDSHARGVETYILDTTSDHAAKRLAAVENKVSIETINSLQSEKNLLFTLFQKAKADESYNLAMDVQKELIGTIKAKYSEVSDHGVKEAPFFVLMGAKMPCILVELSFISNPAEEKRLNSEDYQNVLAQSLANGIEDYIKKKNVVTAAAHD